MERVIFWYMAIDGALALLAVMAVLCVARTTRMHPVRMLMLIANITVGVFAVLVLARG